MPDLSSALIELHTFIAPLTSQCQEIVDWPLARFEVQSYLHHLLPPDPFITSVRAIVIRRQPKTEVLVVQDPDGYHIVPGGRREEGETLLATVRREVLEETGWQVTVGSLLGFNYFRRLTPKPSAIAYPHSAFVQLVYLAEAHTYLPTARETDGYELSAEFVPIEHLHQYQLTTGERCFLQAVLQQRGS